MTGRELPNYIKFCVDLARIPELKLSVVIVFDKMPMSNTLLKVGSGVCANTARRVLRG